MSFPTSVSITFGECVETHAGMEQIGKLRDVGFTVDELKAIKDKGGNDYELIMLSDFLTKELREDNEAAVLVIRNGLKKIGIEESEFYKEQMGLEHDKKAFMKGRVVNKLARHNLCYANFNQEPEYEKGKGRVYNIEELNQLNKMRKGIEYLLGEKAKGLFAEMNNYYDEKKCGIGFHGDTERKIVVCARLGKDNPLAYQWYNRSRLVCKCGKPIYVEEDNKGDNKGDEKEGCKCKEPVSDRIILNVKGGDIYVMSDKAVGFDWKKNSKFTLRHAAGSEKYTTTKFDKKVKIEKNLI